MVAPERTDDIAVEGLCGRQTCRRFGELLVVFHGSIERYKACIVDIHLLILLAIERELERKLHLLEVCLVDVVRVRHVFGVVVHDVNPLERYVKAVALGAEDIVHT